LTVRIRGGIHNLFSFSQLQQWNLYHFTVDLLFDWFGISCITTDNFHFYLQNRLIQASQTGSKLYSSSSTTPFSFPCLRACILPLLLLFAINWFILKEVCQMFCYLPMYLISQCRVRFVDKKLGHSCCFRFAPKSLHCYVFQHSVAYFKSGLDVQQTHLGKHFEHGLMFLRKAGAYPKAK
jgi:hypothetical protein